MCYMTMNLGLASKVGVPTRQGIIMPKVLDLREAQQTQVGVSTDNSNWHYYIIMWP